MSQPPGEGPGVAPEPGVPPATGAERRDLIVRVADHSDYFCDLSPALQDEIIARTEHEGF